MPNHRSATALVVVAAVSGGCTAALHAPPTRLATFQAPRPVMQGDVNLTASGGVASGWVEEEVLIGAIAAELGVADQWSIAAAGEVGAAYEDNNVDVVPEPSELLATGQLGVRFAPTRHFNAVGGLTVGGGAVGGFVGPTLGVTYAYGNRWLTPFAGHHVSLSFPFDSAEFTVRGPEGEIGRAVSGQRPQETFYFDNVLGFEFLSDATVSPFIVGRFGWVQELGQRDATETARQSSVVFGVSGGLRLSWSL